MSTATTIPVIVCPDWCAEGSTHLLHFMNSGEVWHARRFSSKVSIDQLAIGDGVEKDLPPMVVVLDLSDELTADEAREHGLALVAAANRLDEINERSS